MLIYPSRRKAVIEREKIYASLQQGEYMANYSGAWGSKEIVPASWYGEGVEMEFNGLSVIGPKEYDKWLSQVYGDYMIFPPIEKRISHHYVDIIDLNKTYIEYKK